MSTNDILHAFAKVGINLDPPAYEVIKEQYDKVKYKKEYLDMVTAIAIYDRKANNKSNQPTAREEEAIKWVKSQ